MDPTPTYKHPLASGKRGPKVLAALSGGVDSSCAALMLKRKGYHVLASTMKLLGGEDHNGNSLKKCCSASDIEDARKAAQILDLDFLVFNFRLLFAQEVITRFADLYSRGLTPNPCVLCNRYMKWHHLWDRAKALGCDYIATGHYARVEREDGRYLLKKARDLSKDQSYVLYHLTQEELSRTLFPLGDMLKTNVRKIAHEAGLLNAQKPESQDICFVPQGGYADFLEGILKSPPPPGDILDLRGNILGRHKGIHHYTIGQRQGLGLPGPKPSYVLKIDADKNTIIVGGPEDRPSSAMLVGDFNLIAIPELKPDTHAQVKIRYRHKEVPSRLFPQGQDKVLVEFQQDQKAVSPGQAAVFYLQDTVLGGGTIISVL